MTFLTQDNFERKYLLVLAKLAHRKGNRTPKHVLQGSTMCRIIKAKLS